MAIVSEFIRVLQAEKSKLFCFGVFLLLGVFVTPAYAQSYNVGGMSAFDMIQNLAKQLPNVMRLVTAIAYVMGMTFIILGVMKLKHAGEMRTMMSHEHSIKGPIIFLVVGAMLIYLPTTVQMGLNTFWTQPNPYGYITEKDQWSQFVNACYSIIQLIGVIAFIRGLILLSQLSGQGGHQGALGKGLTHIIGGLFLINIYQFIQVVLVTLGVTVS